MHHSEITSIDMSSPPQKNGLEHILYIQLHIIWLYFNLTAGASRLPRCSVFVKIHFGQRSNWTYLNHNNSVADCLILLKFGYLIVCGGCTVVKIHSPWNTKWHQHPNWKWLICNNSAADRLIVLKVAAVLHYGSMMPASWLKLRTTDFKLQCITGGTSYLVIVVTALHGMQTRSSDGNSVCLSVCLSVRLSNACIVTKRKKAVFKFLYHTKEHLS